MRMKSFLLSMLAVAALASCSNESNESVTDQGVNMKFKFGVAETKAIQDPGTNNPVRVDDMTVYLRKGTNVIATHVLTTQQIAAAQTEAGVIFEKINPVVDNVKVIANTNAIGLNGNISAYQTALQSIPFEGEGAVVDNNKTNPNDGHKLVEASITIKGALARFEIKSGINVTEAANGVYAVDVKSIYINNYFRNMGTNKAFFGHNADESLPWAGDWVSGTTFGADKTWNEISFNNSSASYYATNHNIGVLDGKVDAYHLFPDSVAPGSSKATVAANLPHIILEVEVYRTAADYASGTKIPYKRWITIRSFNDTTTGALITKFEGGKIYRLDLGALAGYFEPADPSDPTNPVTPVDYYPEEEEVDLALYVTVEPWTIVSMTPNI